MNKQRGSTIIGLVVVILWIVGFIGWCMNIYKGIAVLMAAGEGQLTITGMLIARAIGIFLFPLGGILGYF